MKMNNIDVYFYIFFYFIRCFILEFYFDIYKIYFDIFYRIVSVFYIEIINSNILSEFKVIEIFRK